MKLPTNYHKNRHLNIDILFVKKIQIFVLSSIEDQYMNFETLFFNYNKYILYILQQVTQSQRLKNVFTVLEGVFKNINEWICSNLHTNLTKYITDSQVHTTNVSR